MRESLQRWLSAFYKTLRRPRPDTFLELSGEAGGKLPAGIGWLVAVALFASLLPLAGGAALLPETVFFSVIALPIGVMLWAATINALYRRIYHRQTQHYGALFYCIVCIVVPTTALNALLVLVPVIGSAVNWVVPLYQMALVTLAVMAVTRLKVWQALLIAAMGAVIAFAAILLIPALVQGARRAL